ncbi:MAG TPA: Grx4 family monothiol glutaredoxin [Polyangiaceae bacterium]|nr:Grx4 family monothiol glutaredoxin [Polyangiaceae bacterium]
MNPAVRQRIADAVQQNPVVLYMKGTRQAPQCGFSARVVELLDGLLDDYVTVNVLADAEVREGIKDYSSWPTIPQLYVRGEFVGGADIVTALGESGELAEKLGELVSTSTPKVTLSDAARTELTAAIESANECIRLEVSATFEHDLAVGVPDPRDVIVDAGGVRVSMPRSSVARADGIRIDLIQTPDGPAFKIENPNEPVRVKSISAVELKARLDRGDDLVLVDVRPADERELAMIEAGRPLDEALHAEIGKGPRDRAIVLYCHRGSRSQRAAEELVQQGFRDVYNLTGGIHAWSLDVDPDVPMY